MNFRITCIAIYIAIFPCIVFSQIPGAGIRIGELSDDFEDTSWTFYRSGFGGTSSNGMWYGSFRGAPETLLRVTPPVGGLSGQTGALKIQSVDNDGDGTPTQEDLVFQNHSFFYDRNLIRADHPSVVAHIYMPPYSSLQKAWSTIGIRIEARSSQLNPGYYYPSIWLQYANNRFDVVVRMGDGLASDQNILNVGNQTYMGGWVTVGISFDSNGTGYYYFKQGISSFTVSDKIYDTTMFPGGSNAKMDYIAYHFISIGYPADNKSCPEYIIDDISVYGNVPKNVTTLWSEDWDRSVTGANPSVPSVRPKWSTVLGDSDMRIRTDGLSGYYRTAPNGVCSFTGWAGMSRSTGAAPTDIGIVAHATVRASYRTGDLKDQFMFYVGKTPNLGEGNSGVSFHYINWDGWGSKAIYKNASGSLSYYSGWNNILYGDGWQDFRMLIPKASGATTVAIQVSPAGANVWNTIYTVPTDSSFEANYFTVRTYFAAAADNMSVSKQMNPCEQTISIHGGLPGDANSNCYVDIEDFAILAEHWLRCMEPNNLSCN